MPWKLQESGALFVDDNQNPVWVGEDGQEKPVDYPALTTALTKATKEAVERKEKLRKQEPIITALDGVEDVQAFVAEARKNAETVKGLDDKSKDAEAAARARVEAAVTPLNKRIAELETARADAEARYHRTRIDAQFGMSSFVNGELANAALARELFAKHFSIDSEDRICATDAAGEVIYDEGGIAGFDTALRKLVMASPWKDIILKGSGANGSDARNGSAAPRTGLRRPFSECKTDAERASWLDIDANLRG